MQLDSNEGAQRIDGLLNEGLISDADFRSLLREELLSKAAMVAVRLVVTAAKGSAEVETYEFGNLPSNQPDLAVSLLSAADAVRCRCEIWSNHAQSGSGTQLQLVANRAEELLRLHWGSRDPHTLLPNLKTAGLPARFAATAKSYGSSPLAVLHTDLDNFKKINTEFGEADGGDVVLAEFARRFRLAFNELGVTVRTGGDEFSAILDLRNPSATIEAVERFRLQMQCEPFSSISRANTCSIGLSLYDHGLAFATARDQDPILHDARLAEQRAKDEGRNRICLLGPRPEELLIPLIIDADGLLETALASRRFTSVPGESTAAAFEHTVRHRLQVELAHDGDIVAAINRVRDNLGLLIGRYASPEDRPPVLSGIFDAQTWARIVVSALLEATFHGAAVLDPNDELVISCSVDGSINLEVTGNVHPLGCIVHCVQPIRAVVGRPFYPAGVDNPDAVDRLPMVAGPPFDPLSPVLLLPIGDEAKTIADSLAHLVAGVVDVDDRPARGGALPDFWQSTVSRVIRATLANPNISTVVAIGDESYAELTMTRLRAGDGLDVGELQRRLSMNTEDLGVFKERRLVVTSTSATRPAVLRAIEAVVGALAPSNVSNRPIVDPRGSSRRRLLTAPPTRTHRLDAADGLRTRTLADAYPEALQLIRAAPADDDQQEPLRGLFREITGFKVVLTEPTAELIPDYWRADSARLESYYKEGFCRDDRAFGAQLLSRWSEGGPTIREFALTQTVEAAMRRTPTRRINLPIVPRDLRHPLGLCSIQILPRIHASVGTLDMIFVWRTVDALVGFPFSAYGSIRWSQDFLDDVNTALMAKSGGALLRLGTVTYIALSFHLYLHDGDVEIARTIVQDATI